MKAKRLFFGLMVSLGLFHLPSLAQQAQDDSKNRRLDRLEACTELRNEITYAFGAEDWKAVEKVADRYIASCSQVVDKETLASIYGSKVLALTQLKQWEKGRLIAEKCIEIYYGTIECHIFMVEYFDHKAKPQTVREKFSIALKVIDQVRERKTRDLEGAKGVEKDALQSTIEMLNSAQGYLIRTYFETIKQ